MCANISTLLGGRGNLILKYDLFRQWDCSQKKGVGSECRRGIAGKCFLTFRLKSKYVIMQTCSIGWLCTDLDKYLSFFSELIFFKKNKCCTIARELSTGGFHIILSGP